MNGLAPTMRWNPVAPAATGCVGPRAMATADPYMLWAEASAWASLRRAGEPVPSTIDVMLQLRVGQTPGALLQHDGPGIDIAPAYRAAATRFCTARVTRAACRRLSEPGHPRVERLELAMPVLSGRPRRPRQAPAASAPVAAQPAQGQILLGVIDTGCAFAHAHFRRGDKPRLLSLWDQDPQPAFGRPPAVGRTPQAMGYGRELVRSDIVALIAACTSPDGEVDEDRCYDQAGMPELRHAASHGSFVLDHFIGPLRLGDRIELRADVPASRERNGIRPSDRDDVVFVQLPRDTWADPNGLALAARVLDGLHHVLACKGKDTKRVVVNISCALYTGPHNGSTILDLALQALVEDQEALGCSLEIFTPTGNGRQARWHAKGVVDNVAGAELLWRVAPGCESPSFVQLWVDAKPQALEWWVQAPRQRAPVRLTETCQVLRGGAKKSSTLAVAVCSASTARGCLHERGTLLLLAVAAATGADQTGGGGLWRLRLRLKRPRPGGAEVVVRVARNESELGEPARHRPAQLVDASADPQRCLREAQTDPPDAGRPAIRVLREGTVGAPASGPMVHAVAGAYRPVAGRMSAVDYSGEGLHGQSGAAVADSSRSVPGIPGAGTRSAGVVRLQGTSFASPQMARLAADRDSAVATGPRYLPAEMLDTDAGTVGRRSLPSWDRRLGRLLVIPRRG